MRSHVAVQAVHFGPFRKESKKLIVICVFDRNAEFGGRRSGRRGFDRTDSVLRVDSNADRPAKHLAFRFEGAVEIVPHFHLERENNAVGNLLQIIEVNVDSMLKAKLKVVLPFQWRVVDDLNLTHAVRVTSLAGIPDSKAMDN